MNDAVDVDVEVVQRLDDVAATLAAIDLDALSDDELHALTIGARRALERLTVGVGRCLARWDARTVWAGGPVPLGPLPSGP